MNRLAYQLIVDKKVKRQIAILSVLSSQKYPATLEDLSEHIGASERTISNDIYQLIEIAPPEVKIKITPKIGITLVCDPSFLISDFILELAENNPVFEILDNLFNGVVETIEDYSERLFISESTLRQKLLVLKKVLREYQLELSLTPLALTGDEINIRCFFFSYYRNSSNKSFMMPEENQVNLHSTVIDTFKKHENGSLYSDYRRAVHWLIIVEQRMHSGHFVQLPPELVEKQMKKDSYRRFKKIYIAEFSNALQLSALSEDEIVFAFLIRLDTIVYRHIDTTQFVMMHEEEIPENILLSFLDAFFVKFNLTLQQDTELFGLTKAFLTNSYLLNQVSPLLQKNSFELNHKIKNLHPSTYTKCLELVVHSKLESFIQIKFPEDFAVSLTLIVSAYTHNKNLSQKKVLFSLSGETTYLNYFIMICNCFLPRNLEIIFSFNEQITVDYLLANKIDVWVHNYYIEEQLPGILSYQLSSFPTNTEWSTLLSELIDITPEILHDFFDSNLNLQLYK